MSEINKKKSMKKGQFISAAVEIVMKFKDDKSVKSLQNVIDKLEIQYKSDNMLKLPCRDSMYKYLSGIISEFEQESDVSGLNPFGIFKQYCFAASSLNELIKISPFNYKTLAEDANGFYIGLLNIKRGTEKDVSEYLYEHFSDFVTSIFVGIGGVIIIFKSANKEAEFYNLLTPLNSDNI